MISRASEIEPIKTRGERLHHDVADRGGFRWTGYDLRPRRVGGELAQQPILGAAANDVDNVNRFSSDQLKAFRDPAIF